jgi:uncharacterized Zn finger protein
MALDTPSHFIRRLLSDLQEAHEENELAKIAYRGARERAESKRSARKPRHTSRRRRVR